MNTLILQVQALTARAKLMELLLESIPQFLTQFLAVSAKGGPNGYKEFTTFQMISVMTSVLSICYGVAKNSHKEIKILPLAYELVSFAFILSEVVLIALFSRFTFSNPFASYDFTISTSFPKLHLLYTFPLIFISLLVSCFLILSARPTSGKYKAAFFFPSSS